MNNHLKVNGNKYYAKKKFGQNFLNNDNIIEKIVDAANLDDDTLVVEIGPGTGAMTQYLSEKAGYLICYEIDNYLHKVLLSKYERKDNVQIKNIDFLKVDLKSDIGELLSKYSKIKVVANLPYYITSPILTKLLEEYELFDEIIIMVQKEVGIRLASKPKNKSYGSLSVFTQVIGDVKLLFDVGRKNFTPQPNVDSVIVKITVNPHQIVKEENFESFMAFVYNCFSMKRKTLLNNLALNYNNVDKDLLSKMIIDLFGKNLVRAEELSIDDFIALNNSLVEKGVKKL